MIGYIILNYLVIILNYNYMLWKLVWLYKKYFLPGIGSWFGPSENAKLNDVRTVNYCTLVVKLRPSVNKNKQLNNNQHKTSAESVVCGHSDAIYKQFIFRRFITEYTHVTLKMNEKCPYTLVLLSPNYAHIKYTIQLKTKHHSAMNVRVTDFKKIIFKNKTIFPHPA